CELAAFEVALQIDELALEPISRHIRRLEHLVEIVFDVRVDQARQHALRALRIGVAVTNLCQTAVANALDNDAAAQDCRRGLHRNFTGWQLGRRWLVGDERRVEIEPEVAHDTPGNLWRRQDPKLRLVVFFVGPESALTDVYYRLNVFTEGARRLWIEQDG